MGIIVADSYSETNKDNNDARVFSSYDAASQSFTAVVGRLDSCKFYLSNFGSVTGNCYAKLYTLSGTHGTDAVPSGLLATSDAVDVTTIPAYGSSPGNFGLITFNFTGANRIQLAAQPYCLTVWSSNGSVFSYVLVGSDSSTPSHGGNYAQYTGTWAADNSKDLCFYIYEKLFPTGPMLSTLNV